MPESFNVLVKELQSLPRPELSSCSAHRTGPDELREGREAIFHPPQGEQEP